MARLLGHRKRRTTAVYAHLDDRALQDAAAQAAAVIAGAIGYRAEPAHAGDAGRRSAERPTVNRLSRVGQLRGSDLLRRSSAHLKSDHLANGMGAHFALESATSTGYTATGQLGALSFRPFPQPTR